MPRVSKETIAKLNDFICALPEEAKGKCALCNQTLVHIVKQAESQTGAGTATVTRALADDINKTAAPLDRVVARSLEKKVHYADREEPIIQKLDNKIIEELEKENNREIMSAAKEIRAEKTAKTREKREENKARLEEIASRDPDKLNDKYDVIVIDPPWPMQKILRDVRPNQFDFDYSTMSEGELTALEIPAADNCHIWLWTTQKFLPMAFRLLKEWQFRYLCTFVWHKPGGFQPIGLPQYNAEFALYARKGRPEFYSTQAFNTCFKAPRGKHSEKPQEFYDMVKRVTAGKRLDMFNRRQIEGFMGWGFEAK